MPREEKHEKKMKQVMISFEKFNEECNDAKQAWNEVADQWQMDYNHYKPHSSLDYMVPATFAARCLDQGFAALHLTQDKENCCEILS